MFVKRLQKAASLQIRVGAGHSGVWGPGPDTQVTAGPRGSAAAAPVWGEAQAWQLIKVGRGRRVWTPYREWNTLKSLDKTSHTCFLCLRHRDNGFTSLLERSNRRVSVLKIKRKEAPFDELLTVNLVKISKQYFIFHSSVSSSPWN